MSVRKKDEALADAIAGGLSYRRAAEHAGVSLSTVQRRMAEPGFRRRVDEIRAARLRAVNDRLLASAVGAAERLAWLMEHADSQQVQARAANALLTHARGYMEATELEQQIRELQELLSGDLEARGAMA